MQLKEVVEEKVVVVVEEEGLLQLNFLILITVYWIQTIQNSIQILTSNASHTQNLTNINVDKRKSLYPINPLDWPINFNDRWHG